MSHQDLEIDALAQLEASELTEGTVLTKDVRNRSTINEVAAFSMDLVRRCTENTDVEVAAFLRLPLEDVTFWRNPIKFFLITIKNNYPRPTFGLFPQM